MAPPRNQFSGHAAALLSRLENAGPPRASHLPSIPQTVKRPPVPKMDQSMISPIQIRFPRAGEDPQASWSGNKVEEVPPLFRSPRRAAPHLEPIGTESSSSAARPLVLPSNQPLASAHAQQLPASPSASSWGQTYLNGPAPGAAVGGGAPVQHDGRALQFIPQKVDNESNDLHGRSPNEYASEKAARLRNELEKIQLKGHCASKIVTEATPVPNAKLENSQVQHRELDDNMRSEVQSETKQSTQYRPKAPAEGGPGFVRRSANFASNRSAGSAGRMTPPPEDPKPVVSAAVALEHVQTSDCQDGADKSEVERERAAALKELAAASPFDYNALKAAVEHAHAAGVENQELAAAEAVLRRAEAHRSLNSTLNHSIEVACEIASVGSANGAQHLDAELEVLRGALETARATGLEGSDVTAAEDFLYQEEKRADAVAELRDAAASGEEDTIRQAICRAREVGVDGQELSKAEVFLWKENLIKSAHAAIEDALAQHDCLALRSAIAQARVAGMSDEDRVLVVQEFLTRGYTLDMLQLRIGFDAWRALHSAPAPQSEVSRNESIQNHEQNAMMDFQKQIYEPESETHRYSDKWGTFAERLCQLDDAIYLLREDLMVAVSSRDAHRIRRAVLQAIKNGIEQTLINKIVLDVQKTSAQSQSREVTPTPAEDSTGVQSDLPKEDAGRPVLSEDKAATKVQAVYRGRTARVEAKVQRQRQVARQEEDRAAVKVQSMYRGRAAREEAKYKRRMEMRQIRQRTETKEEPNASEIASAPACAPVDLESLAQHAVDVGITREDLVAAEHSLAKEEANGIVEVAARTQGSNANNDVYQELSLALQSGDSVRVRCAVQAAEAAGINSREVKVLAAALRGDNSVDPASIAVAAMSLAGCGIRPSTRDVPTESSAHAQLKQDVAQNKTNAREIHDQSSVSHVSAAPSRLQSSTPDRLEAQQDLANAKASKDVKKLQSAIDHAKRLGVSERHILAAQTTIDHEERKKKAEKELAMAMWGGDMEHLAKVLEDAREACVPRSAIAVAESILEKERAVRVAQDELTAAVNSKNAIKIQECLAAARAAGVPRIRIAVAERALQATSAVQVTEEELMTATKTRDPQLLRNSIKAAERAGVDEAKIAAATWALRDVLSEAAERLTSVVQKFAEDDSRADGSTDFTLLNTALTIALQELGDGNNQDEGSMPLVQAIEAAKKVLSSEKGLVHQAKENLQVAAAKNDLKALQAAITVAREADVEPSAIIAAQNALWKGQAREEASKELQSAIEKAKVMMCDADRLRAAMQAAQNAGVDAAEMSAAMEMLSLLEKREAASDEVRAAIRERDADRLRAVLPEAEAIGVPDVIVAAGKSALAREVKSEHATTVMIDFQQTSVQAETLPSIDASGDALDRGLDQ
eukprot:gnl/MRDRNA2_/MRDRNA2_28567_c0_seq1.p1 gnl/MRDRNA2_/MRDRNA2_28567_c0~~gnl/MRDRNA2_/MRDRNA2_28567_c0_seq1.p1  ORF type:complete len:1392 (-),score=395.45 gnl/MRDRNA2_/MRDRNA2_28567_c0_seq1:3-4178(-)